MSRTFGSFRKTTPVALILLAGLSSLAHAEHVLLLATGSTAEDSAIQSALQAQGDSVTIGPQFFQLDGTTNLSGYQTVLMMPNYDWENNMLASGEQNLVNFVNGGGGLVTAELTTFTSALGLIGPTLRSILPATFGGTFSFGNTVGYSVFTPDATLDRGLPSSFQTNVADYLQATESVLTAKKGATTFFSSTIGDGADGWNVGSGRVLSFSIVYGPHELSDPHFGTLLGNGIAWASGIASVPEPSSLILAGTAALIGLGAWARRRMISERRL